MVGSNAFRSEECEDENFFMKQLKMFANPQTTFLTASSIWINVIIFLMIFVVCYCGDELLSIPNRYYRAACDNSTHALIGGLCWAVVESEHLLITWKSWMNCLFCVFIAMSVDFDHFLAAGSLNIERASHLSSRPILHNTSLILVIVLLCWLVRHKVNGMTTLALMILSSCLSHHLRDANRRGLWLHPFGTTPPLSFPVYVSSIVVLAWFVRFVWYYTVTINSVEKSIDSLIA